MTNRIINKRWAFFVLIFLILIALGLWSLSEELGISIAVIVIGITLLLGYVFVIPNSYVIDAQGIVIYYGFGLKTKAYWNELKRVEDHHSQYGVFPWFREYQIGYFKTKFALWENAHIPKNKKTKALIEKYYKKHIEIYG